MANTPQFVSTANIGFARPITSSNTPDGSLNLVTLVTGASNGTRVDRISIVNSQLSYAITTANVVRVYVTDTSGLNPRLINEVVIPADASARTATTISSSVGAVFFPGGLFIASGQLIQVGVSNYTAANQVDIVAYGGNM